MKLKKIIFPFFNTERHHFLTEKWWFRLFIVFYIVGAVIFLWSTLSEFSFSSWGWCYDSLYLYLGNDTEYNQHFNQCKEFMKDSIVRVVLGGLLYTAVIHYVIQFVFFKVVMDFVVLGGKEKLKV